MRRVRAVEDGAVTGLTRGVRALDADRGAGAVLADAAALLRRVVPIDAAAMTATDPATVLPSTAAYIHGLPPWSCGPYWDLEYLEPDVLAFADLHRAGAGATTLHRVTEGRPGRSRRHREILTRLGLDAQARATVAVGGACYGFLDLLRGDGAPDFTDDELRAIDVFADEVALLLRRAAIAPPAVDTPLPTDAAVIVMDDRGTITSMTPEAQAMLALLPEAVRSGRSTAVALNAIAHAVWARARFLAAGFDAPEAVARVALADGRRVTLRGTCTRAADGRMGATVLTLAPTRRSRMGPLVLAAHDLTDREREVVRLLLRGGSAQQIASALGISLHTVRTHVKRVHEKVGVSSRAELTRLFIDEEFLADAQFVTAGS